MSPQKDSSGTSWLRYSHLGMQFTITVLMGTGAGYLLDEKLATQPWLLTLGTFAGFGVGTYLLVRGVSR